MHRTRGDPIHHELLYVYGYADKTAMDAFYMLSIYASKQVDLSVSSHASCPCFLVPYAIAGNELIKTSAIR